LTCCLEEEIFDGAIILACINKHLPGGHDRLKDHHREKSGSANNPAPFLKEHIHLLPPGRALDLAMGRGRNSIFLAEKGYEVRGIEKSPEAAALAEQAATRHEVKIAIEIADLEIFDLPANSFDVIIVFYYLQRSLFAGIIKALRRQGALMYETYTTGHLKYRTMNPDYLLEEGELRKVFAELDIEKYEELDMAHERKAVARLLAFKRGGDICDAAQETD
jgi:tellurite methyltransferase